MISLLRIEVTLGHLVAIIMLKKVHVIHSALTFRRGEKRAQGCEGFRFSKKSNHTLARTSGNVKRSAQILHYPRPTFYRKLKKLASKSNAMVQDLRKKSQRRLIFLTSITPVDLIVIHCNAHFMVAVSH